MPEDWIDEALPPHDPTDAFVASSRDELRDAWRDVPTSTVSPELRDGRRIRWVVPVGLLVAASLVAVVVLTRDDDQGTIVGSSTTADTQVPDTAGGPTTTAEPTTTVDPTSPLAPLLGHRWVRMPTDEPWPLSVEPTLEFDADGTVRGFDGCADWTATIEVAPFEFTYVGAVPQSSCASIQPTTLAGATWTVTDTGDGARLSVAATDGYTTDYVAADTLEPATAEQLVGHWQPATGERLTILADGTAALGPCDPAATWTLTDGTLTVDGFQDAPQETVACSGGTLSGVVRGLMELGEPAGLVATVSVDGDHRLVSSERGDVWVRGAAAIEPPLDLWRGTIRGFAPMTDVDSDFVVGQMNRMMGEPTFDSGWFVTEKHQVSDGEDCYGGLSARVVQWGDVAFGFLRLGEQDRLWITGVGDLDTLSDYTRLPTPLRPAKDPTGTTTIEGLGVGSTVDQLAMAGIGLGDFTDENYQLVADPNDAVRAYVQSLQVAEVTLDNGVITSILTQNPGFC